MSFTQAEGDSVTTARGFCLTTTLVSVAMVSRGAPSDVTFGLNFNDDKHKFYSYQKI